MLDFLAALGLVLAMEGLFFAALPHVAKSSLRQASESAPERIRLVGVISAVVGVAMVWLVRRGLG